MENADAEIKSLQDATPDQSYDAEEPSCLSML